MSKIIYTAIIRKPKSILCEYTESSGNFQQISIKTLSKLIRQKKTNCKTIVSIVKDSTIMFILLISKYSYITITTTENEYDINNIFSYLMHLHIELFKLKSENELSSISAFSLSEFIPVMKVAVTSFNVHPTTFVNITTSEYPLESNNINDDSKDLHLSMLSKTIEDVNSQKQSDEMLCGLISKGSKEEKDEILKTVESYLNETQKNQIRKGKGCCCGVSKQKCKQIWFIIGVVVGLVCLVVSIVYLYFNNFHKEG